MIIVLKLIKSGSDISSVMTAHMKQWMINISCLSICDVRLISENLSSSSKACWNLMWCKIICCKLSLLSLDMDWRLDLIAWILSYRSRIWSAEYIDTKIARMSLCRLNRSGCAMASGREPLRITLILTVSGAISTTLKQFNENAITFLTNYSKYRWDLID